MDKSDFKEFCKIMYLLAENFSATVTQDGLNFRFAALKKYSIEQIKAAALTIAETRKYTKMPTVADFVTAIEGDQEHADEDRAELEAMGVIDKIKRLGSYTSPRFADVITADLVKRRFGGWENVCQLQEDHTAFFVRDFKAAYLAATRENKRDFLQIESDIDPEVKKLTAGIGG